MTPACVPYVSIHLFGEENFKRGEFMAALQRQYAQTGFSTRRRTPGPSRHPAALSAAVDAAERQELVEFCLLGPLGQDDRVRLTRKIHIAPCLKRSLTTLAAAYPGIAGAAESFGADAATRHCVRRGFKCGCGCGSHLGVRSAAARNSAAPNPL